MDESYLEKWASALGVQNLLEKARLASEGG